MSLFDRFFGRPCSYILGVSGFVKKAGKRAGFRSWIIGPRRFRLIFQLHLLRGTGVVILSTVYGAIRNTYVQISDCTVHTSAVRRVKAHSPDGGLLEVWDRLNVALVSIFFDLAIAVLRFR